MAKYTIRRNCHETNSSSMHAICITNNDEHMAIVVNDWDVDDCVWVDKDGKLIIYDSIEEGFGRWPFKILYTFEDKLSYAICSYLGDFYGDEARFESTYKRLLRIVSEIIPEVKEFRIAKKELEIYRDINGNPIPHDKLHYAGYSDDICQYTYTNEQGEEINAVMDEAFVNDVPDIGCVDHQSRGLLQRFLKEKKVTLKEFLTNKKYIIIQDGDEYYYLDKYIECGIIDRKFIKEIYK